MKNKIRIWKAIFFWGTMLFLSDTVFAEKWSYNCLPENKTDTASLNLPEKTILPDSFTSGTNPFLFSRHLIHRIGIEARPSHIIPTHPFFEGENDTQQLITNSFSAHLKYSFQFQPNTYIDRIYGGAYQGVGLAYYTFGESKQIGDPIAFYLFQGARIAELTPRLSFNYEWNFGVSSGWHPYNSDYNSYNKVIGSKTNAYINTNFYLNWILSSQLDLITGFSLTHFSNGNTGIPNAGLNTVGMKVGLIYKFDRKDYFLSKSLYQPSIPKFPRHISYDLVLFGSWRRKGVNFGDEQVASPDTYTVLGFNFAPMYNLGYKLRVGISADGVYDSSANVYTEDYIASGDQPFYKPPISQQLALGLSARAEYIMPFFTVNIGMGVNVLHGGGDLKGFYQILALKTEVTRSSFIHIGYCLQDFHTPNYLMLGIGYRFNNKYPIFHR